MGLRARVARKAKRGRKFGLYRLTVPSRMGGQSLTFYMGFPQVLEYLGDNFPPDAPVRRTSTGYEILDRKPQTELEIRLAGGRRYWPEVLAHVYFPAVIESR